MVSMVQLEDDSGDGEGGGDGGDGGDGGGGSDGENEGGGDGGGDGGAKADASAGANGSTDTSEGAPRAAAATTTVPVRRGLKQKGRGRRESFVLNDTVMTLVSRRDGGRVVDPPKVLGKF